MLMCSCFAYLLVAVVCQTIQPWPNSCWILLHKYTNKQIYKYTNTTWRYMGARNVDQPIFSEKKSHLLFKGKIFVIFLFWQFYPQRRPVHHSWESWDRWERKVKGWTFAESLCSHKRREAWEDGQDLPTSQVASWWWFGKSVNKVDKLPNQM